MTTRRTHVVAPPVYGASASVSPADQELLVGLAVFQLFVSWPQWVERRVESVRFIDEANVRRQMSVDFQLPAVSVGRDSPLAFCADAVRDMVNVTQAPPVPLTTLHKTTLVSLNVWAENDRRLPMLNKPANGRITGAFLALLAEEAAKKDPALVFDEAVRDYFYSVAERTEQEALYLLKHVQTGFRAVVSQYGLPNNDFKYLIPRLMGREPVIKRIFELNPDLHALCQQLASDFLLMVLLNEPVYERRIVKFSYEEPTASGDVAGPLAQLRRTVWQRCSWSPKQYAFARLTVGTSETHHFEFEAPEFTEIIRADMLAEHGGMIVRDTDRIHTRHAHVRLDRDQAGASAWATAAVKLRARRGGPLTAAAALAVLIAMLFWLGQSRLSHIDVEAAAAILLAVPALLVGYLIRPGEHSMATLMLSGVRAMLAISGVCLLVAAGAIAGGLKTHEQAIAATATASNQKPGPTPTLSQRLRHKFPVPGGPYLDRVWEPLKWIASVIAMLVIISNVYPRRPRLKEPT